MNEEGRHKELQCDVCSKWVDERDIEIIQDLQICVDVCLDLASLRVQGFIKSAHETARQLVA